MYILLVSFDGRDLQWSMFWPLFAIQAMFHVNTMHCDHEFSERKLSMGRGFVISQTPKQDGRHVLFDIAFMHQSTLAPLDGSFLNFNQTIVVIVEWENETKKGTRCLNMSRSLGYFQSEALEEREMNKTPSAKKTPTRGNVHWSVIKLQENLLRIFLQIMYYLRHIKPYCKCNNIHFFIEKYLAFIWSRSHCFSIYDFLYSLAIAVRSKCSIRSYLSW